EQVKDIDERLGLVETHSTQNIRGITNITKQIDCLKFEDKDLDIIGLTETWPKDENLVYYPTSANQKKLRTHVTKWIIQELNNYIVKDRHYTIVMENFNVTFNPKIDRFNINIKARNRSDKPESQILRFLDNNSIQEVKSRIDQIWVSDNLADQLFCADIIPSDLESHSDHACAIAEIEDNILKYTKSITDSIKF
ncbi:11964_t:CDS:2, partial [Diversispora eburnea]